MEEEEWSVKWQARGALEKWVGLLEGIGPSLEAFWLEGGFWWGEPSGSGTTALSFRTRRWPDWREGEASER